jgi:hypothetical protein
VYSSPTNPKIKNTMLKIQPNSKKLFKNDLVLYERLQKAINKAKSRGTNFKKSLNPF